MSSTWHSTYLRLTGQRPRRRPFIRYLPGDRTKSYRPRLLRIGTLEIPLPFFGGR